MVKEFEFVDLFPGWIPTRFSEVADRTFGFLSIDVDLYQPIRDALEFFYPRLCGGAIIYLDDYGFNDFPGARLAVDEFFAVHTPTYEVEGQLIWGATARILGDLLARLG